MYTIDKNELVSEECVSQCRRLRPLVINFVVGSEFPNLLLLLTHLRLSEFFLLPKGYRLHPQFELDPHYELHPTG